MQLTSRPYHLLLLFAVLLAIISLAGTNNQIDIHQRDTYYVLDIVFIIRTTAMFLLLLWLLYMFTFKFLFSKALAILHISITIIVAVVVSVVLLWKAKAHVESGDVDIVYANIRRATFITQLFVASMMLTQLLFFINLFAGVLKRVN